MNRLRPALGILLALATTPAFGQTEQEPVSMQKLLEQVRQGQSRDAVENKKREQAFIGEKAQQETRIQQAIAAIEELESISAGMEQQFNANELLVNEKREQRDERLGSLKELFGHLTSTAGDMRSEFRSSITNDQFPDREAFLTDLISKMNTATDLPTLEELERVWYELHRDMTESGRVVRYATAVGTEDEREIVRIGLFNLIADGEYLAYNSDTRTISALPRQPAGLSDTAKQLQSSPEGHIDVGIDPTGARGGAFLKAIVNTPTLRERWHQGREVGYIITAIGGIALLLALWRFLALGLISTGIRRQLTQSAKANNPLGRILKVAEDNKETHTESLELKLDEAILKERPAIQSGLSLLRIIAMVAPLLGLLGTVSGMIIVFQAITIYGAGDPKAMAGGISSALITTVLGLLVAIPALLLHTLLHAKAQKLLHILEVQSAGIVAERAER